MHMTTISSWALMIAKAIDICGIDSREVFALATPALV